HQFRMGNEEFLVFALEFGPRLQTINWANRIVAKHPKHRVIVTTHAYLYSDDTRYDWDTKGKQQHWNPRSYIPENVSDGEMMWRDFISRHPNIELVACGHVLNDG